MADLKYSIIIPVYNRPDEVEELLTSLIPQTFRNFEVIIVEDGSSIRCEDVVDRFRDQLVISYYFKANSGPGPSRNFGFTKATGDYFIIFDSDCIIPGHYMQTVNDTVTSDRLDAYGGPDTASEKFTKLQRAMGYTMSSVFTTGGIRGASKRIGVFQPRSFNMGISREVFVRTGGFAFTHFAEDIELSVRMSQAGFRVGLIPHAYVYHKRRATLSQFFQQVNNFGRGRVQVGQKHPSEIKLTHWFPALFTLAIAGLLLSPLVSIPLFYTGLGLFSAYLLVILVDAAVRYKSLSVGLLSVPSALVQLCGYGLGFLSEKLGLHRKR